MKDLLKIAFGVACGLLAAGLVLLVARPPAGAAISLLPPPTQAPLVVHVSGAIGAPGMYSVAPGSRVQDAVEAAGGLLPQADLQAINLAAWVQDGQQVVVPAVSPTPAPTATLSLAELQALRVTTPARAEVSPTPYVYPSTDNPVNINTADQAELESLPDIGPFRAEQILKYRDAHGPFKRVEDLLKVYGISKETFEVITDLVTVGNPNEGLATPSPTPTR